MMGGGAAPDRMGSPAQVMGHGAHGEMSMAGMVRDMRNRFLVAAVLAVAVTLWSRIGRDVLGFSAAAPFGWRDDVFQLVLSLPVVFYSAWVFFAGAARALRDGHRHHPGPNEHADHPVPARRGSPRTRTSLGRRPAGPRHRDSRGPPSWNALEEQR